MWDETSRSRYIEYRTAEREVEIELGRSSQVPRAGHHQCFEVQTFLGPSAFSLLSTSHAVWEDAAAQRNHSDTAGGQCMAAKMPRACRSA